MKQSEDTKQKMTAKFILTVNFLECIKAILTENASKKMEPIIGIEPMTYSLRVNCSTD